MTIDVDPNRSASHCNMIEHLAGPFEGGAVDTPLALTASGANATAVVDWVARQPLLLVGTRQLVNAYGYSVTVQVTPRGGTPAPSTVTVRFAPFSEAGAWLPVWPGAPLATPETAPLLDVVVSATGLPAGAALTDLVGLRLVEGVLGRLLYVVGAEKQRIRRQARELYALRRLAFTFDPPSNPEHQRMGYALDRLGSDLGVPRLTDQLAWDKTKQQLSSTNAVEPHDAYRQRLELYRPFLLPTRRCVARALETVAPAATVQEPNAGFAVAIQLVASPDDMPRRTFLANLRANYLLQPGGPLPPDRLLPSLVRTAQQGVVDRLAANFDFPTGSFVAPLLAEALDRVGRCRAALGVTRKWKVLRAQDDARGSRYELGLGVDVELPPATELDAMAQALAAKKFTAGADVATLALLGSLTPAPSANDPAGRWLLQPCGLKTIHQPAADRWYLSHFSTFGTVLHAIAGAPVGLEARFQAPGDPGQNVVLWYGLADAVNDAQAAALPAWTQLATADARTAWAAATVPAAATLAAFQSAGLSTPPNASDLARTTTALGLLPDELSTTLKLDATMAAGLISGAAPQVAQLTRLVSILHAREVAAALPLVRGTDVLLTVGAAALPGAANLNSRRLGFRWYALPVNPSLHDHTGSADYRLLVDATGAGQDGWRRCNKCRGLVYAGSDQIGACPAGDVHDSAGSGDYRLTVDAAGPGQDNWRRCTKCQGLAFAGNPSLGACPAGGVHDHTGSGDYRLDTTAGPGQDNWRWCNKCQGLAFAGAGTLGACPASAVGTLDRALGPRNSYTQPAWPSLAAVIAVSLAREDQDDPRGRIQPYEVRVDLPDGTLLDLATYERLMNLLERAAPLGVVVDTRDLRERHVDQAGAGTPTPLVGRLAHTFRKFQQRRHRGAVNTDQ